VASPIGHAAVGLGAAALVARATGTPDSMLLWLGTPVASLLPDFDLGLRIFGLKGPRYHRNATHSLAFIALVIAVALAAHVRFGHPAEVGVLLAWSAALATHPFLDVITTGPTVARLGYGIPLFWPISRRRYFVQRPVLVGDRSESQSWQDTMREMREEVATFGLLGVVVLALVRLFP
jgi:membrane-bound metal-dependent hydrolase YbcI (DUF457 family)